MPGVRPSGEIARAPILQRDPRPSRAAYLGREAMARRGARPGARCAGAHALQLTAKPPDTDRRPAGSITWMGGEGLDGDWQWRDLMGLLRMRFLKCRCFGFVIVEVKNVMCPTHNRLPCLIWGYFLNPAFVMAVQNNRLKNKKNNRLIVILGILVTNENFCHWSFFRSTTWIGRCFHNNFFTVDLNKLINQSLILINQNYRLIVMIY